MGGIQKSSPTEIEQVVRSAITHDINFFDLCAGEKSVYEPFGRVTAGQRDRVFFQLHFGAVYNDKGEYGWSRNLKEIFDSLVQKGILDYIKEMKTQRKVHHIEFSSHTLSVAERVLDTGLMDMMMFSINPAYDLEQGDERGTGFVSERAKLFRRCEMEGVDTVMEDALSIWCKAEE